MVWKEILSLCIMMAVTGARKLPAENHGLHISDDDHPQLKNNVANKPLHISSSCPSCPSCLSSIAECPTCLNNQEVPKCPVYESSFDNLNSNDSNNLPVAFTAEITTDRSIAHFHQFTFDTVLYDTGKHFTRLLGTFECPDSGAYAFCWSIHAPEGRVVGSLVIDGDDMKYGPMTAEVTGSYSGTSSMASVLQCSTGSKVWVKAVAWPDDSSCNQVAGVYSSFTGFKIFHEDDVNEDGVAFTAQYSVNTSLSSPNIFVYDHVLINLGGHYDEESGEFTCPSDGIYVFTISAHTVTAGGTAQLIRNGVSDFYGPHAQHSLSTTPDSGTSSSTVLIQCEEGDVITVVGSPREYIGQATALTGYRLYDPEREVVAFHARLSDHVYVLNGDTIKFNQTLVNEGNYFNTSQGFFVCPDEEVYFFSWTLYTTSENDNRPPEARLMMGENVVKYGPRGKAAFYYSSSSIQAVVKCEEQKAVYLQAVAPTDDNPLRFQFSFCNFIGFRLPSI